MYFNKCFHYGLFVVSTVLSALLRQLILTLIITTVTACFILVIGIMYSFLVWYSLLRLYKKVKKILIVTYGKTL